MMHTSPSIPASGSEVQRPLATVVLGGTVSSTPSGRSTRHEVLRRCSTPLRRVLELARRLHEAGVPLAIGTDSTGGGPFYARELELHAAAGIPAWDVLGMATAKAAERLGLGSTTGALRAGLEADIVFLARNPLEDIGSIRSVETVVVDGRVYQPRELLQLAKSFTE